MTARSITPETDHPPPRDAAFVLGPPHPRSPMARIVAGIDPEDVEWPHNPWILVAGTLMKALTTSDGGSLSPFEELLAVSLGFPALLGRWHASWSFHDGAYRPTIWFWPDSLARADGHGGAIELTDPAVLEPLTRTVAQAFAAEWVTRLISYNPTRTDAPSAADSREEEPDA